MDTNNWRPARGGELAIDEEDWRAQLLPDWRQRIVNGIDFEEASSLSGQTGMQEIEKITLRFEEKVFTVATSQPDYLRRIYTKMLTFEDKSQLTIANSFSANPANVSINSTEPVMYTKTGGLHKPQGDEPVVDASNWRALLLPDSRQIIVNKIMEILKRHIPFSGQEGLQKLNKIAVRFEEKVFTKATSQMLTLVTKYQNPGNSLSTSLAKNSKNPTDPNNVDDNMLSKKGTAIEKGD